MAMAAYPRDVHRRTQDSNAVPPPPWIKTTPGTVVPAGTSGRPIQAKTRVSRPRYAGPWKKTALTPCSDPDAENPSAGQVCGGFDNWPMSHIGPVGSAGGEAGTTFGVSCPFAIPQDNENVGSRFNADRWVQDFQEAGASYVIFYDKWIDGLVFHDTKTTNFKTKRDFLRELAAACQRGGLPLVTTRATVSRTTRTWPAWRGPCPSRWLSGDRRGRRIARRRHLATGEVHSRRDRSHTGRPARCAGDDPVASG